MIQIQDWESSQKIVVVDENHHGTVQVEVPKHGPYKDEYYQYADCAIFCLWVDEKYRKQGTARLLMEAQRWKPRNWGANRCSWSGMIKAASLSFSNGISALAIV